VTLEHPESRPTELPPETMPEERRRQGRRTGWGKRLLTASAGAAVGLVLLLLPWLPSWDQNYFSGSSPAWFALWMNSYFRGAISGVGALNVYIAFAELLGLLRGSKG
jgi:hypothetical protein